MKKRSVMACIGLLVSAASAAADTSAAAKDRYVAIPSGSIRSVLNYEDVEGDQAIAAFDLMRLPVTNADFLNFVKQHPEWRRDRAPSAFAEPQHYLSHWKSPAESGDKARRSQPVTQVSWFAATAYCEADHARLPTWIEWEYVAAADPTRRDARSDPAWREHILAWYARPSNTRLAPVGQSPANAYGVHDLHGLIWEWTEDYAAMLVSGDNRTQSDPDLLQFCGASALSMDDRENYAVLMRVAMLSSLQAVNSTSNLGFRCARDAH